jgi:hypothetical protein
MARSRRFRPIPWILLFDAAMIARDRWGRLTPRERSRLAAILRKSHGRPGNLTAAERREFRRMAGKLDLMGVIREVGPLRRRWLRRKR